MHALLKNKRHNRALTTYKDRPTGSNSSPSFYFSRVKKCADQESSRSLAAIHTAQNYSLTKYIPTWPRPESAAAAAGEIDCCSSALGGTRTRGSARENFFCFVPEETSAYAQGYYNFLAQSDDDAGFLRSMSRNGAQMSLLCAGKWRLESKRSLIIIAVRGISI